MPTFKRVEPEFVVSFLNRGDNSRYEPVIGWSIQALTEKGHKVDLFAASFTELVAGNRGVEMLKFDLCSGRVSARLARDEFQEVA